MICDWEAVVGVKNRGECVCVCVCVFVGESARNPLGRMERCYVVAFIASVTM